MQIRNLIAVGIVDCMRISNLDSELGESRNMRVQDFLTFVTLASLRVH